jgi:hypothetical protein
VPGVVKTLYVLPGFGKLQALSASEGEDLLRSECEEGDKEMASDMLEAGCEVRAEGRNPLKKGHRRTGQAGADLLDLLRASDPRIGSDKVGA